MCKTSVLTECSVPRDQSVGQNHNPRCWQCFTTPHGSMSAVHSTCYMSRYIVKVLSMVLPELDRIIEAIHTSKEKARMKRWHSQTSACVIVGRLLRSDGE